MQGIIAQQQSSSHKHDVFGFLIMLATIEDAGLDPVGGILNISRIDFVNKNMSQLHQCFLARVRLTATLCIRISGARTSSVIKFPFENM